MTKISDTFCHSGCPFSTFVLSSDTLFVFLQPSCVERKERPGKVNAGGVQAGKMDGRRNN